MKGHRDNLRQKHWQVWGNKSSDVTQIGNDKHSGLRSQFLMIPERNISVDCDLFQPKMRVSNVIWLSP
jgi:hypothetical protein